MNDDQNAPKEAVWSEVIGYYITYFYYSSQADERAIVMNGGKGVNTRTQRTFNRYTLSHTSCAWHIHSNVYSVLSCSYVHW